MDFADSTTQEVYEILKKYAEMEKTLTYLELTEQVASKDLRGHWELNPILERISAKEHADGRGMLSVLVVNQETGIPGKGFFTLASQLYRRPILDTDEPFFHEELQKVFDKWSTAVKS